MALTKTPWFSASDYRPTMPGPFECISTLGASPGGHGSTFMRWWNGRAWSWPLDVDPECYDNIKAPPASHYPTDDVNAQYLVFNWRGYNEDADPL